MKAVITIASVAFFTPDSTIRSASNAASLWDSAASLWDSARTRSVMSRTMEIYKSPFRPFT